MVVILVKKPRVATNRPSTSKHTVSDSKELSVRGTPLINLQRPDFRAALPAHVQFVRDQVSAMGVEISSVAEGLGLFAADANRQQIWFVQQLNRIRCNQAHILAQLDVIATRLAGSN